MKKACCIAIVVITVSLGLNGCATIFKGYESEVRLINVPEGVRIFDTDTLECPVYDIRKKNLYRTRNGYDYDTMIVVGHYLTLRSNKEHLLLFRGPEGEKKVRLYPKLDPFWFLADMLTLTFPVDMYTGSWNNFDAVDYKYLR